MFCISIPIDFLIFETSVLLGAPVVHLHVFQGSKLQQLTGDQWDPRLSCNVQAEELRTGILKVVLVLQLISESWVNHATRKQRAAYVKDSDLIHFSSPYKHLLSSHNIYTLP